MKKSRLLLSGGDLLHNGVRPTAISHEEDDDVGGE